VGSRILRTGGVAVLAALLVGVAATVAGVWATATAVPFAGAYSSGDPRALRGFGFSGTNIAAWSAPHDLDVIEDDGMRGILWTGGWLRSSCTFEMSDASVAYWVRAVRDHPALYAIQLSDEPRAGSGHDGCSNAIAAHEARRRLIERTAPGVSTLVTLDTSQTRHYAAWRGAADIVGLVVYPCTRQDGCRRGGIAAEVAAARAAGLDRIMGVVQAFGNDWAKMPSATELDRIMTEWHDADVDRYMYYAFSGHEPQRIDNTPAVHERIRAWNHRIDPAASTRASSTS